MNIHIRIIIIIAVMALVLQGCAALAIFTREDRTATIQNPIISKNKGFMAGFALDNLITSKDLLDTWGKPDHIEQISTNKDEWTYNFGLRWNGISLFVVIIPIPIFFPVGHDYVTFTIENGKVFSAHMKNDSGHTAKGCYFNLKANPILGCPTETNIISTSENIIIDEFMEKDLSRLLR